MKLLLFLQLKDLVRAVLNPPKVVSKECAECPWTKPWAYGHGRWCRTCWGSAGGWQEPGSNSNALSQDALMRKEWNKEQAVCSPQALVPQPQHEPRADKHGPGHVPMIRDCVSAHYKLQLTAVTMFSGLLVSIQGPIPYPQVRSSSYIHCWELSPHSCWLAQRSWQCPHEAQMCSAGHLHAFPCAVTMWSITMESFSLEKPNQNLN